MLNHENTKMKNRTDPSLALPLQEREFVNVRKLVLRIFLSTFFLQVFLLPDFAISQENSNTDSLKQLVDSLFIISSAGFVKFADLEGPARKQLIEMKEQSVPYLIPKLSNRDARDINTLIELFKGIGDAATAQLLQALQTEDIWQIRTTCRCLAEIKDRRAVPGLIKVLNHPDYQIRNYATTALGNTKDTTAFNSIVEILKDSIEVPRKAAAYALGELNDKRGVPYLISVLSDKHFSVRMVAMESLVKIGKVAIPALIQLLDDWSDNDSTEKPNSYYLAIEALGKIKEPQVLPVLLDLLKSPDWMTKGVAVEALGNYNNPKITVALTNLKKSETHPFVKDKIEKVLEKIGKS